jgi:hypothetical protein
LNMASPLEAPLPRNRHSTGIRTHFGPNASQAGLAAMAAVLNLEI